MSIKTKTFITVLWIGLVAGTLDIADNLIFNQLRGIGPERVFRYIASGLIGIESARRWPGSIALGVAIHYAIALFWTALFYLASRKFITLLQRPVIGGLVYGGFVYLFVNFVVLPLSRVPIRPAAITLASRINGILAILLFIGLTISLLMRRNVPRA